MEMYFSGGANEVGASSTSIKIDGYRILVDAGIRMNHEHTDGSPLPDFSVFNEIGMPDAVLLTHAHTDHTGALPDLHKRLPADVKIYCTEATKAITEVLLKDSIKVMQREEQQTGKAPHTPEDVAAVLNRMETVPWADPIEIRPGLTAKWTRAGHILGAAMIDIKGKSETLLMTGDVSVTKQLTIPSVDVPAWCKQPDVMMMESTYGNRPHKVNRREEEKRLAADVANTVIKEGGTVLIPVFAIGRAQETILILKQAMERKEIPKFPVYVDGMVRDVNKVYTRFADELQRPLRRKAKLNEPLFDSDVIGEVPRNDRPEDVLAGGPCCIVASSGMLNGGKSIAYAKQLIANPKSLIAITGYQAEGTPGRALENCRKGKNAEDRAWSLGDKRFDVKCRVERYSLSAHANKNELIDLVRKARPREKLFLVHGDTNAREAFFESAHKQFPDIDVKLPENGETYLIEKQPGIASGRRHTMERILSEVHACLLEMRKKGPFHTRELAEFWFGSEAITEIVVKFVEWCLSLDREFFRRGSNNLFYLR